MNNSLEQVIIKGISETICVTASIQDLAGKVSYIGKNGDSNWFDVNGETYGVDAEGVIMDEEGVPASEAFLSENWELIEVLRAAAKSA